MRNFLAISNHADFLGGGEHSFLDLLTRVPTPWRAIAALPERGKLAARLKGMGVEITLAPLPPIRPWNTFAMLGSVRALRDACRSSKACFIYANGSRAAFYGGWAGRITRRPVFWHCRITERDKYLDPVLTALSKAIIVNSRATALRFKKKESRKVKVVYNGLNLEWLREKGIGKPSLMREEWKVLLLVSRISRWKRHDLALKMFEKVASSDPHAHLVCVGAPDELEPRWWALLQEISSTSTFADRIHWIGHVEDVRPWYRAANLLILPSEHEPFGRVLVEAMASGVPVVATRSGGVPEIVRSGQDGFLVPIDHSDAFADAVLMIMKDEGLRAALSESAVRRADDFGIDHYVQGVFGVFQESMTYQEMRFAP